MQNNGMASWLAVASDVNERDDAQDAPSVHHESAVDVHEDASTPSPSSSLPTEQPKPQQTEATTEVPATDASHDGDAFRGIPLIVLIVVAVITLLVLLRVVRAGQHGGLARLIRARTEQETPLERLRRLDRKKRAWTKPQETSAELRVQRRRSPVRPLRELDRLHAFEQDDRPVLSRELAVAREKIPADVPSPPVLTPTPTETEADVEGTDDVHEHLEEIDASVESLDQPPVFSVDELRAFSSVRYPVTQENVRVLPRARHEQAMQETEADRSLLHPSHGVSAHTRAARTLRAASSSRFDPPTKTIDDMDEFVAPLPIDIVLQLLEELLDYAQDLKRKKGYDTIVYIETDPTHTHFQRGHDGHIRVQHAADAFAKPSLALDVMRRRGFSTQTKVADAHLLSLVHLGRYLLGSASPDDVVLSMDGLSMASSRFSDEEIRLLRYLLAPEEHVHLQNLVMGREREGGVHHDGGLGHGSASQGSGEGVVTTLPCPHCASEVEMGDLACRQCGTPLHPRPVYCASCGMRNLLFADGRTQHCSNLQCDEEILVGPNPAESESVRLSVVAEFLPSFEEFRVLPAHGAMEHYEVTTHDRLVEIWQLSASRAALLIEDDRPRYGLTEIVTLPQRSVERNGVLFVMYDPPAIEGHPLHQLGAEKLAEGLLMLFEHVHGANLRMPSLVLENLTVSGRGDVCLMHGHVLQSATAATPRMHDVRFMAPELHRQTIATERSDLYTLAAIWVYAISGQLPGHVPIASDHDAFVGTPDTVLEWMNECLRENPADRPSSANDVLVKLHGRRRLEDLI